MTFWEIFGVVLSSAGLFASILGAFLTYAARKNGQATRDLINRSEEATRELINRSEEATRELTGAMEERLTKHLAEMTRHFVEVLERMDRRADERHREVIDTIKALKAA